MKCGNTCVGGTTRFVTDAWADDCTLLRATAAARLRKEWLQRWWCKKYNRPRKDPLLAEYTLEELMLEYLEDLIEMDPHEEFAQDVQHSGAYVQRTGDELLDQWQEKAARGEVIDFDSAFGDEESRKLFEQAKERSRKRGVPVEPEKKAEEPEEFHDDYSGGR